MLTRIALDCAQQQPATQTKAAITLLYILSEIFWFVLTGFNQLLLTVKAYFNCVNYLALISVTTIRPCTWVTSVGMVTSFGLDDPSSIPVSARLFPTPQRPDRLWDPLSQRVPGVFPGLKPQGREAHLSAPSNAEVKKGGAIPPHPRVFMIECLTN
jgi:hypothetical protein